MLSPRHRLLLLFEETTVLRPVSMVDDKQIALSYPLIGGEGIFLCLCPW